MKKTKVLSIAISMILGIGSAASMTSFAETKSVDLKKVSVGTTYLRFDSDSDTMLKGEDIYSNGRYDLTWDVKGNYNFINAVDIDLCIEGNDPIGMGEYGEVKLDIEEIWVDGEKYDGGLARQPLYAWKTDGVLNHGVIKMEARLKNRETAGFKATDSVRVVFSVTGLRRSVTEMGNLYGDVNSDDHINAVDASLVLSHYSNISTNREGIFNKEQSVAADFNSDGSINAVDASAILYYYARNSVTNNKSTTIWQESEISKLTKQVSTSYKPFELNRVVDETDLIFIGKVIGLSEYDVQWKDENGESWGPYRNAVIPIR